ncbi:MULTISPECIES: hypothetical protein [Lysinibacillus]|uniref:DUF4177 domain-containing protein n=1 Tax=Lysinibacillus capsici TaxID=2115968 RepID=A0A2X0XYB9_9BACI|nr:hypothetical protein [Lysinibacillus capsici]SPT98758.1 Uncharacterised protein [Lysinibacillus capsici]
MSKKKETPALAEVKELRKFINVNDVNEHLKQGWKLLAVHPHGNNFYYLLFK